jgi:hypothetical protein
MAYEMVGENPNSHLGICVRMNIWSWPEFLQILASIKAISFEEKNKMLLNDCGIIFSHERCKDISEKLHMVVQLIKYRDDRVELDDYKQSIANFLGKNQKIFLQQNEIILAHLFLRDCGGFWIR